MFFHLHLIGLCTSSCYFAMHLFLSLFLGLVPFLILFFVLFHVLFHYCYHFISHTLNRHFFTLWGFPIAYIVKNHSTFSKLENIPSKGFDIFSRPELMLQDPPMTVCAKKHTTSSSAVVLPSNHYVCRIVLGCL